ncbi:MAG: hypothetical protein B6D64_05865 [Bacteroidetes bacterium 4484_276]|nr:MAG: hypothetical protein B6D64_05865 [Bacteroidetes bacterium 4484_276]OYT14035.1 MAG: hypothetical protein B6I19_01985 [Bacteroidetes bacterium 4572_114]
MSSYVGRGELFFLLTFQHPKSRKLSGRKHQMAGKQLFPERLKVAKGIKKKRPFQLVTEMPVHLIK